MVEKIRGQEVDVRHILLVPSYEYFMLSPFLVVKIMPCKDQLFLMID